MPHCLDLHDVERMTPAAATSNLGRESRGEASVGIRAMGRAELPVRIEKYDLHVNRQNTEA
jgi:hypothetical protein